MKELPSEDCLVLRPAFHVNAFLAALIACVLSKLCRRVRLSSCRIETYGDGYAWPGAKIIRPRKPKLSTDACTCRTASHSNRCPLYEKTCIAASYAFKES